MRKKLKSEIIKLRTQIRQLRDDVFGSYDFEKYVVITRSRTGSTFLMSSLNSHPNLVAYLEMFRELKGSSCKSVWKKIFSKKSRQVQLVGFKIFYYHPLDSDDREVWDFLINDKTIKVIHLKRDNLLRTVLSGKIALKTNVWTNKSAASKVGISDKKMSLDVAECLEEFEKIKRWEDTIDEQFSDHQKINISYEDLVTDSRTLEQVLEFLEVDKKDLSSSLKKQNREKLEELIENYQEFSQALNQTKWAYLLEQE